MEEEIKKTTSFKDLFRREVKYIVFLIVFIFGVISPFYNIREKIATIDQKLYYLERNHVAHIEDDVEEMRANNKVQDQKIDNLSNEINGLKIEIARLIQEIKDNR